jgi:hypothetical protein
MGISTGNLKTPIIITCYLNGERMEQLQEKRKKKCGNACIKYDYWILNDDGPFNVLSTLYVANYKALPVSCNMF